MFKSAMIALFSTGLMTGLTTGAALAQGAWFQHEYGEIRSFHQDWMAACADAGSGACRILRASADPGSGAFFDQRLTLHRIDGTPDWVLEVMDRDLPASELQELVFDFGSSQIVVPAAQIRAGDYEYGGASDSVTVRDGALVDQILTAMKKGRNLTVRYSPQGAGDGRAQFPLRGVTRAAQAVQSQVLPRQE